MVDFGDGSAGRLSGLASCTAPGTLSAMLHGWNGSDRGTDLDQPGQMDSQSTPLDWTTQPPTWLPDFALPDGLQDVAAQDWESGLADPWLLNMTSPKDHLNVIVTPSAQANEAATPALFDPARGGRHDGRMDTLPAHHAEVGPSQKPPQELASLVRIAAELAIKLGEHAATVPPMSIHRLPRPWLVEATPTGERNGSVAQSHDSTRVAPITHRPSFAIDDTFHLTQSLIELYPSFVDLAFRPSAHSRGEVHTEPSSEAGHETQPELDHASVLLILSCHHRLVDVWESIFAHFEAVLDRGEQLGRRCGKIAVRSFEPPQAMGVKIQMVLMIQFAEELCAHIRRLLKELALTRPTSRRQQHEAPADAVAMASDAVLKRAEGMLERIVHLHSVA